MKAQTQERRRAPPHGSNATSSQKEVTDATEGILTLSFSFFLGSLLYFAIDRSCSKRHLSVRKGQKARTSVVYPAPPNSCTAEAHAPKLERCLPLLASPKRSFKVLTSEQDKEKMLEQRGRGHVKPGLYFPERIEAHALSTAWTDLSFHRPWPGDHSDTSYPGVCKGNGLLGMERQEYLRPSSLAWGHTGMQSFLLPPLKKSSLLITTGHGACSSEK